PSSVVSPRPRGRPPGSKNKLKIPIVETHVNRNVLSSHVLDITHGADLSTSLLDYVYDSIADS
ncbi:putative DNA-binding protein ESCAROLA-like, partial [Trifolium medium]|nr:putative DNA-binding protein ESCAROLA-like [Trifolium medium]